VRHWCEGEEGDKGTTKGNALDYYPHSPYNTKWEGAGEIVTMMREPVDHLYSFVSWQYRRVPMEVFYSKAESICHTLQKKLPFTNIFTKMLAGRKSTSSTKVTEAVEGKARRRLETKIAFWGMTNFWQALCTNCIFQLKFKPYVAICRRLSHDFPLTSPPSLHNSKMLSPG
jgi:hypothetical protein